MTERPHGLLGRLRSAWGALSLDAKVVGVVGVGNWLLLFGKHYSVQATTDGPLWQLFPGWWAAVWLLMCGLLAWGYPFRDLRDVAGFSRRARVLHLAAMVTLFVVVPTVASIVLRETGKPFTYVHDGAIMVEEAARKLLAGQNPYAADYLDTPLFFWPMINNPALYHLTYFPFLFLVTVPFVLVFDALGIFWDQRYLYLPAYVATLVVVWWLIPARLADRDRAFALRASLTSIVALDPQLFPFVAEGRNDFVVLLFFFAGVAALLRDRLTLATFYVALASAAKLHAVVLLPFLAVYLIARSGARDPRSIVGVLWRHGRPAAVFLAVVFVPFLVNDPWAFYDDVVLYNSGGAAWSYPISGMGFSAILRALGVIEYPQQDFPFAAFQLAAAVPLAAWSMRRLWRDPSVPTLLGGYALTLLAFLFFGRYFHGNYLGYVLAVAAPVPFLWRVAGARRPSAARYAPSA